MDRDRRLDATSKIVSSVDLPVVSDRRGNLSFVEGMRHIPFEIARVYYLFDVPGGSDRAGHAHRELQQLLIAVSGSFDVRVTDGRTWETVTLDRPSVGMLMSSMVWRELTNFTPGAVCLVLASMPYLESDYIRSYDDFLASVRSTP